MAATPGTSTEPTRNHSDKLLFAGVGVVVVVSLLSWAALHLAGGQTVPANPFAAPIGLVTGDLRWPTAATVWLIVILLPVAAAAGYAVLRWRRRPKRSRVDRLGAAGLTGGTSGGTGGRGPHSRRSNTQAPRLTGCELLVVA